VKAATAMCPKWDMPGHTISTWDSASTVIDSNRLKK
jgi:hypothetical protein